MKLMAVPSGSAMSVLIQTEVKVIWSVFEVISIISGFSVRIKVIEVRNAE